MISGVPWQNFSSFRARKHKESLIFEKFSNNHIWCGLRNLKCSKFAKTWCVGYWASYQAIGQEKTSQSGDRSQSPFCITLVIWWLSITSGVLLKKFRSFGALELREPLMLKKCREERQLMHVECLKLSQISWCLLISLVVIWWSCLPSKNTPLKRKVRDCNLFLCS